MNKIEMNNDLLEYFYDEMTGETIKVEYLNDVFEAVDSNIKSLCSYYPEQFSTKSRISDEMINDYGVIKSNFEKLDEALKGLKGKYNEYYYKIDGKIVLGSSSLHKVAKSANDQFGSIAGKISGAIKDSVYHVDKKDSRIMKDSRGRFYNNTDATGYYFNYKAKDKEKYGYDFLYNYKQDVDDIALENRKGEFGKLNKGSYLTEEKYKKLETLYKLERGMDIADKCLSTVGNAFDMYDNWTNEKRSLESKIIRTGGILGDTVETFVTNDMLSKHLKYGSAALTLTSDLFDIWQDDNPYVDNIDKGIATAKSVFDAGAKVTTGKVKTAFQIASGVASIGQNVKDFCDSDKTEEDKIRLGVSVALTATATATRIGGEIAKTALITAGSAYGPVGTVVGAVAGCAVSAVCNVVADCLVTEKTIEVATKGVTKVVDDVKVVGEVVKAGINDIKNAKSFSEGAAATAKLVGNTALQAGKVVVDAVMTVVETKLVVAEQTVKKIANDVVDAGKAVVNWFKKW